MESIINQLKELGYSFIGFVDSLNCETSHVYSNGKEQVYLYLSAELLNIEIGSFRKSFPPNTALCVLRSRDKEK